MNNKPRLSTSRQYVHNALHVNNIMADAQVIVNARHPVKILEEISQGKETHRFAGIPM